MELTVRQQNTLITMIKERISEQQLMSIFDEVYEAALLNDSVQNSVEVLTDNYLEYRTFLEVMVKYEEYEICNVIKERLDVTIDLLHKVNNRTTIPTDDLTKVIEDTFSIVEDEGVINFALYLLFQDEMDERQSEEDSI